MNTEYNQFDEFLDKNKNLCYILNILSKSEIEEIKTIFINEAGFFQNKESHNKIIKHFLLNKKCLICHEIIAIPVCLSNPLVFCNDCGDKNLSYTCLDCARNWLQLNNRKKNSDNTIKHLICSKRINLKNINAYKSYVINKPLMDFLDKHIPITITCKCELIFDNRKLLYDHIIDGSCLKSIFKCPIQGCSFIGNKIELIKHFNTKKIFLIYEYNYIL